MHCLVQNWIALIPHVCRSGNCDIQLVGNIHIDTRHAFRFNHCHVTARSLCASIFPAPFVSISSSFASPATRIVAAPLASISNLSFFRPAMSIVPAPFVDRPSRLPIDILILIGSFTEKLPLLLICSTFPETSVVIRASKLSSASISRLCGF